MDLQNNPPSMSQKIFKMKLSVETVSLYLICSSLADRGVALSTKNIRDLWNGTEKGLENGLGDLEQRHILTQIVSVSDREKYAVYRLLDDREWKTSI